MLPAPEPQAESGAMSGADRLDNALGMTVLGVAALVAIVLAVGGGLLLFWLCGMFGLGVAQLIRGTASPSGVPLGTGEFLISLGATAAGFLGFGAVWVLGRYLENRFGALRVYRWLHPGLSARVAEHRRNRMGDTDEDVRLWVVRAAVGAAAALASGFAAGMAG